MVLEARCTFSQAHAGLRAELVPPLIDDEPVIGAAQLDTQASNQRLTLQIIPRDGPLASERERIMGLRRCYEEIL